MVDDTIRTENESALTAFGSAMVMATASMFGTFSRRIARLVLKSAVATASPYLLVRRGAISVDAPIVGLDLTGLFLCKLTVQNVDVFRHDIASILI